MKQETNKPLYRVLFEKATQDEYNEEAKKALDYYNALASENLHHLAEALETIKENCIVNLNNYATGTEVNYPTLLGAISETIEKALSRIS